MKLTLKYIIANTTTYLLTNTLSHLNINYNIKFQQDDWNTYDTILTLANISHNVYYRDRKNWDDIKYNNTHDISKDNETVRAYVFSNEDSTVNIIAIKGTSLRYLSTWSTGKNDKYNDNLYFSCCYYKELSNYKCEEENSTDLKIKKDSICNKNCYKESLDFEKNYYNVAKNIIEIVKQTLDFDKSLIIFTGHSLGGALSTMMGITYNKEVVTFETPGEKHYIDLSGIKYNETHINKIYHYGHNADIIFTGKCKGTLSLCYLGGYIIETKCHIGKVCEYDVKNKLNISESIFTHKIQYVIENIITKWNNTLPKCEIRECSECEEWEYN